MTIAAETGLAVERAAAADAAATGRLVRESPAVATQAAWRKMYGRRVLVSDLAAVTAAQLIALFARFGDTSATVRGIPYPLLAAALVPVWLGVVAASRGYEPRFFGAGTEEYHRVGTAAVRLTALVALVSYAAKLEVARGFVAVGFPLAAVLLLVGRKVCREVLRADRAAGNYLHRVLVVGSRKQVQALASQVVREPQAGLAVVGACVPGGTGAISIGNDRVIPVVGALTGVLDAVRTLNIDTVAVTPSSALTAPVLRKLSWSLENTGVDLLVSPALTDVAGPRISMRPVAGLPLLHVEQPELSGMRQLVKAVMDRVLAGVALLLLAPILLLIALAVRVSSPGPALFRQRRVGKTGEQFTVYKFRSMYADAEARLAELAHRSDGNGVLFKLRDDPRVTPLGRWLRRYSLDELPQLLNVLRGDMSLVGPRPPLPCEVAQYQSDARRRLKVKPGITGLWQVSGRSDLSWEETVRLDLFYVENWSFALDLSILVRTLRAVARTAGAY